MKERQEADPACCQGTSRLEAITKSVQRNVHKGTQRQTKRSTLENQPLCTAALAIFFILPPHMHPEGCHPSSLYFYGFTTSICFASVFSPAVSTNRMASSRDIGTGVTRLRGIITV